MSHGADSLKSILFALVANGAIAIAKFFAASVTGSGSMLAEAIHSTADCGNQLLLLLGLKHAKRPPTTEFPLGYGKAIYFWSFIVALMLFSMGGLFSIYEGVHKLQHPEPLSYPLLALGVLVFGIIAETFSLWGCLREVKKAQRGRSLWVWFKESRQSELIVVVGEDIAALLGLCFAAIAVCLTMVTGNPVYDASGSIVIGLLLIIVAFFVGREVMALLIGQGVEEHQKHDMMQCLENMDAIEKVYNMVTLQLGDDIMVAVKVKMSSSITESHALIEAINRCEQKLKAAYPEILWLFFEPDVEE
jgi:cation diffusion facilitator family transporter